MLLGSIGKRWREWVAIPPGSARGPIEMILQLPLINLFSRSRSDGLELLLDKESKRSAAARCGDRFVKSILAIYLIPALLVVLLVGIMGAIVVGFVRLLCLVGSRFNSPKV